ncbi:MAG: hypothetical protein AAF360_07245 [Pseudomonadota bacterium]
MSKTLYPRCKRQRDRKAPLRNLALWAPPALIIGGGLGATAGLAFPVAVALVAAGVSAFLANMLNGA